MYCLQTLKSLTLSLSSSPGGPKVPTTVLVHLLQLNTKTHQLNVLLRPFLHQHRGSVTEDERRT